MAHLLESQLKIAFHDEQFDFTQFVEEFSKRVERNSTTENESENNMFESEIFEMLFTLTDFVKFKELFMDYKEVYFQRYQCYLFNSMHLYTVCMF
jgi:hypothetical protein